MSRSPETFCATPRLLLSGTCPALILHMDERAFAHAVRRYALQCFAGETSPRVEELARHLGIPRRTLERMTRRLFGCAPGQFLRATRRIYAQRMLRRTSLTTAQVAYRSGYGTRRSLFRSFRKEIGQSPRNLTDAAPFL